MDKLRNTGIRQAVIADVANRIEHQRPIHGFVIDTLSRMHPHDLGLDLGVELDVHKAVSATEFRGMSPEDARDCLTYNVGPTVVPFKTPYNLLQTTKVHPHIVYESGMFDVAVSLSEQRYWLREGFEPVIRVISEELVDGKTDDLTVAESITGMLHYQEQTVADSVVDDRTLVDTTIAIDAQHEEEHVDPEIVICIPVANGQEHETLPRTLRLLAEQSLDYSKYEIVLLHNTRLTDEQYDTLANGDNLGPGFEADQQAELSWLESLYTELTQQFPELRVRADYAVHAPDTAIGYCRMTMGKSVAKRYLERDAKNNPLLLSMDADVTSLSVNFLQNMIETAEATDSPVVAAQVKIWGAPLERRTNVSKLIRIGRFVGAVACNAMGLPYYMDTGTAVRLKEYSLVGGHHWRDDFSENINIVNVLNRVRAGQGQGPAVVLSRGSIYGSHPRRQIDVMARGFHPNSAWRPEVTTFGSVDDAVRTQEAPLEAAERNATAFFEQWVHQMIEQSVGGASSRTRAYKRDVLEHGLKILGYTGDINAISSATTQEPTES